MYIRTKNEQGKSTKYEKISNLSFAPEVDLTGQSLPINDFNVDIYTREDIPVAQSIALYDDDENIWANYWIVQAQRISSEVIEIHAETRLSRLDRSYVDAIMYTVPQTIEKLIGELFNNNTDMYAIDERLEGKTVIGFFPEQTKKERLQWICFAIGAYVKTFFTDKIEIRKMDSTVTTIPANKTFWRPSLSFRDYVKKITLNFFSFERREQEDIGSTDEFVEVNGSFWVFVRSKYVVTNDGEIPKNVATQEIVFNDVYIINAGNVDNVANRLAQMYFENSELSADIINNGKIEPAHLVELGIDPPDGTRGRTVQGHVDSCDFSFGTQARSRIHMAVREVRETTSLIVEYVHVRGASLGRQRYNLSEGFGYSITNPYLDKVNGRFRIIYYPLNEYATGTMHSGVNTNTQKYDDALIFNMINKVNELEILYVSEAEYDEEEGVLTIE